jgi:hypothetical protein
MKKYIGGQAQSVLGVNFSDHYIFINLLQEVFSLLSKPAPALSYACAAGG